MAKILDYDDPDRCPHTDKSGERCTKKKGHEMTTLRMEVTIEAEDDLDYNAGTELGFVFEELQALLDEYLDDNPNVTLSVRRLDD